MRVLFFSDSHLGFDLPLHPRVERRRRGEDFFANLERVLAYAERERVDLVLHGGDLFFRSRVPPAIVDRVYQRLARFAADGIPFGVIAGNHERSMLPPSLWLAHPGLHVFARPSARVFRLPSGTVAVAGAPFTGDAAALLAALRDVEVPAADVRLLLVHEAFEGAAVEGFVFRARRDVVRPATLPDRFDAILSGHVHRHQVLWHRRAGGARLPIIYAGSIERTSWAERDEVKGFVELVIGATERRIRFHPLPTRSLEEGDAGGWGEPAHRRAASRRGRGVGDFRSRWR
jgi:DNA repair exonuclease SbcCD nuclease subunit